MRRIRLITLQGQERTLAHQRELLRANWADELQQHCRAGPKTAEAIVLEQRIRAVHAEWLGSDRRNQGIERRESSMTPSRATAQEIRKAA